jgi:glycosyltransferase involved in cell wall biosynthesis
MIMNPTVSRIAVICDYSLGYLGGAQTALLEEAAALVAAGAEVTIISPTADQVWQRVRPDARVDHVRVPARFTLPGLDLPLVINSGRLRRTLEMIFTERGIQVVHLHSEFGLAAAALQVAGVGQLPVVHTVHTFFWQAPSRGQAAVAALVRLFHRGVTGLPPTRQRLADRPADQALRNMTLTLARRADLVISPSAHQAERLSAAGVDRVRTIPNTVFVPPAARVLDRIDEPLRIIWIGRCVPEKRILTFVGAAVRAVHRAAPATIEFTVAGDGSQLEQARAIAADCPQIRFLGRQEHARIPELLQQSHLLALTSRGFDNQPMTIVEAVMALRGVVYCDTALSEGLAGPGISSPASEEALCDTFVDLARHPERVVEASRAAESARRQFTPEHHAASVLASYAGLVEGARSRP